MDTKKLIEALDRIENKESELLAWGDVDVSSTESEVRESIRECGINDIFIDEYFDALKSRRFIFEVDSGKYRSRMAETVRLQVLSRQWFRNKGPEDTKPLISDFRFLKRARKYPKRDHRAKTLIDKWEQNRLFSSADEKVILSNLLKNGDAWFKLSGFQVRSTERILEKFDKHKYKSSKDSSATIVCAGTGSGKTLSFYLPAMTKLAANLLQDVQARVRILAIYPRKELLKDQFAETYKEARKLDDYLLSKGRRKISIGTFYGDSFYENFTQDGAVFEAMVCPQKPNGKHCGGALSFRKATKQVVCLSCNTVLAEDEILATRERVSKSPPDILFTTTEMLNQRLSDGYFNHLFGITRDQKSIPLVLLDEVHTYEGSTGAQTSYLLKRWMKFSGIKPHFVGLSATLADAKNFFADLTGTKSHFTELVESFDHELEEEGAEYMLALRGDPASQTGLLSATIQATMLGVRMLDRHQGMYKNISQGIFGQKAFVFTDDLDVINRLYNDYLDSEGKTDFYGEIRPRYGDDSPLAYLRSPRHPNYDQELQKVLGLDWSSADEIGHDLSESTMVERTSSQDSGVNQTANVVVATASLEVGYNDPDVGIVIQHKAPRNVASYLQRKGRSGRRRGMRPWMYTILSDFGRDRIAFQQYEQLIDPKVKTTRLPIENSHIHKMHAALATLEWLVKEYSLKRMNVWSVLKEPNRTNKGDKLANELSLKDIKDAVTDVMASKAKTHQLTRYLQDTLALSDEQAKVVMWAPPRSIMMSFLPELRQNLQFKWGAKGKRWDGLVEKQSGPMPKYISSQLFSALDTQSLTIALDRSTKSEPRTEIKEMAFFQALKEFAPGRMSKRYTVKSRNVPDWLIPADFNPVPDTTLDVEFNIEEAFGSISMQVHQEDIVFDGELIPVYQPRFIRTQRSTNPALGNKSSSVLQWHFDISEPNSHSRIEVPENSEWHNVLRGIEFFTHDHSTPLEIVRYCTGAKASIPFSSGDNANVNFNWTLEGKPAAIGTKLWVDSAKFSFRFSEEDIKDILLHKQNKKALYYQYLQYEFVNSDNYKDNYFFANWVFECLICSLLVLSEQKGQSLGRTFEYLYSQDGKQVANGVINGLFQRRETADGNDEEQDLHRRLTEYFAEENNLHEMKGALRLEPDYAENPAYYTWAKDLLGQTLCGGINAMFLKLVSDVSEQSFSMDHLWDGDVLNVWINENEVGGIGYITKFREVFKEDPLRTLGHLTHAFEIGEYEQVNFDLQYFLNELQRSVTLRDSLNQVRSAQSLTERSENTKKLKQQIAKLGILPTHTWESVLYSRVLKSGANEQSDQRLVELLKQWTDYEEQSDLEIPLHIASYLLAAKQGGTYGDIYREKNRIQSRMWQRGAMIREQELGFYNQFSATQNKTERLLLSRVITSTEALVNYDESGNWQGTLSNALQANGKGILVFTDKQRGSVKAVISQLNVSMLEYNKMLFYPRITKLQTQFSSIHVTVEVRDILQ
ncbi:protein DpdJ [Shewanella sp. 3_MG-2023]|uniref:protein DpdJ n=1 Tax=Shewanella sp. 3_MG-2023 TaxID=3062635 RepID=UPI0026E1D3DA|nr:protein DpdJ [Shewanella sp. 3_MG-2023]MDO6777381.1 protein DpdJ [Shewanella sp. 3_MG-2023]